MPSIEVPADIHSAIEVTAHRRNQSVVSLLLDYLILSDALAESEITRYAIKAIEDFMEKEPYEG